MPAKNNQKLKKLFYQDLQDRENGAEKFQNKPHELAKKDAARINQAIELLANKELKTATDYFRAAVIFQHGTSLNHLRQAQKCAEMAKKLGHQQGAWLYAAATDRILMWQGKKQKFGTQFYEKDGTWQLYPIDGSIDDQTRKKYNVLPLAKIKALVKKWNEQNIKPWEDKTRPGLGLTYNPSE